MKTTPLFFGIRNDFSLSMNEQLEKMSIFKFWDKGLKKYIYIFPMNEINKVRNLTRPLLFEETDLLLILKNTNQKYEEVEIDWWKGKSGYRIEAYPNFYRILSYQKEKGEKPKEQKYDVPKERVEKIWKEVFLKQPIHLNKPFKFWAPKICRLFGLKRYFYDQMKLHNFRVEMFQGTRMGGDYAKFYYYPVKVLEKLNLIERKGQNLQRIKSSWEEQTML